MTSINDVLKARKGLPVDDMFAELWGRKLSGEKTKNLFNLDRAPSDTWTYDQNYYLNGALANAMVIQPFTVSISVSDGVLSVYNNGATSMAGRGAGFIVSVKPNTTYTLSYDTDTDVSDSVTACVFNTINTNEQLGTIWAIYGNDNMSTFTTPSNVQYLLIVFRVIGRTVQYSNIILTEG